MALRIRLRARLSARPGAERRLSEARRHSRADVLGNLFEIFPELPGIPRPPVAEQQRRVLRNVARMKEQARANVQHHCAAAEQQRATDIRGLRAISRAVLCFSVS
jgi:hypothetical protein